MEFELRKNEIETRVSELIESLVIYNQMELVLVEYVMDSHGPVLRLVIDKAGGVTLDDCVLINRVAGDALDVHDPVPGGYSLEVSSPGINRPLVRREDYERFSGKKVLVKTAVAVEGRRRFKGVLTGVSDGRVIVETSGGGFALPLELIAKARLDIL